jgi:thiamine biosynthesis lipoprotein
MRAVVFAFAAVLSFALAVAGCPGADAPEASKTAAPAERPTPEIVNRTYRAMGTQVAFTAYTTEPVRAGGAFEAAIAEFRRLEDLLSNWRPKSDISRLNARAGVQPVEVAPETLELLEKAKAMARLTKGKFDVGFGALADLWRFDHDQNNRVPEPAAVEARLPLVDVAALELDAERSTAYLPRAGMAIHVGGIGKGYAVDRAAEILRDRGFDSFMIQAGGDLYAAGRRGDRPWRVGIRDPRGPRSRFFAVAEIEDRTFSTSGDYERFFVKDGVRYHHIIDPDTGRPARGARSVTVFAPSAVLADALSTGVFILGVSRGLELVEGTEGVGAVIVDADNEVHVSRRLKGKVRMIAAPTP